MHLPHERVVHGGWQRNFEVVPFSAPLKERRERLSVNVDDAWHTSPDVLNDNEVEAARVVKGCLHLS